MRLFLSRTGGTLLLATLLVLLTTANSEGQSGRIQGTVTDAQSRSPIENARVSVVGTQLFDITDADGRYEIENVPVGKYDVRVQVIGFQSAVQTGIEVSPGQAAVIDFRLQVSILRLEGVVVSDVAQGTVLLRGATTIATSFNTEAYDHINEPRFVSARSDPRPARPSGGSRLRKHAHLTPPRGAG